MEPRNVYVGLCTNGFNPFKSFVTTPYSCWSRILIIYNLPIRICIWLKFIFIFMVIVLIVPVGI